MSSFFFFNLDSLQWLKTFPPPPRSARMSTWRPSSTSWRLLMPHWLIQSRAQLRVLTPPWLLCIFDTQQEHPVFLLYKFYHNYVYLISLPVIFIQIYVHFFSFLITVKSWFLRCRKEEKIACGKKGGRNIHSKLIRKISRLFRLCHQLTSECWSQLRHPENVHSHGAVYWY